jgi:hypothetical protein
MKRMPRKKVGADWPTSATAMATWSIERVARDAESRPIGTATSAARRTR